MHKKQKEKKSALRRAVSTVTRLFQRGRALDDAAPSEMEAQQQARQREKSEPRVARTTRRETDIPLDLLDRAYTPPATSSKASFRSDGADHQQDQEFPLGRAESEWKDEDRYTNKSGDPRIGTHRRTYEPDYEPDKARAERE